MTKKVRERIFRSTRRHWSARQFWPAQLRAARHLIRKRGVYPDTAWIPTESRQCASPAGGRGDRHARIGPRRPRKRQARGTPPSAQRRPRSSSALSAIFPAMSGSTAPSTMAMHQELRMWRPADAVEHHESISVKMTGNMIELKRPDRELTRPVRRRLAATLAHDETQCRRQNLKMVSRRAAGNGEQQPTSRRSGRSSPTSSRATSQARLRLLERHIQHILLMKEVGEEAADRHFAAHVARKSVEYRAEHRPARLQRRQDGGLGALLQRRSEAASMRLNAKPE